MSRIVIEKITTEEDMREACNFTMFNKIKSKQTLDSIYNCRHSPMRTQLFKIKMYDIPTSVSVHFVRHSCTGQLHFVSSNRPDRGGDEEVTRDSLVNHLMYLNAQHIEEMSWKRLCHKAEDKTREVMEDIRIAMFDIDRDLCIRMVPECFFLGRCLEPSSCGLMESEV